VDLNSGSSGTSTVILHPLLSRINIALVHKSAIEDLSESIQNTQAEAMRASLEASGRGPAIPFTPARAVEEQLASRSHRTWCVSNINLLAPISIPMWKLWASLSDVEVKASKDKALNRLDLLKDPIMIPNAFPLAMFDHHKCTTTKVQVLAKQDMLTYPPRHKKYSVTFWNCQRPYIRCMCEQDAASGCKGTMLWFDQAMWFLVNNLERFFDSAYGNSLVAKFGTFITWLSGAARLAVHTQITFMVTRRLMVEAALEGTVNPDGKLLASYYEAPGTRQVECYIKNAQFSLTTAPSPSPTTNKRCKFNASGAPAPPGYVQPQMRPVPMGRAGHLQGAGRRGRGGYNRNFRPSHTDQ
jgi:hypothetical protein